MAWLASPRYTVKVERAAEIELHQMMRGIAELRSRLAPSEAGMRSITLIKFKDSYLIFYACHAREANFVKNPPLEYTY